MLDLVTESQNFALLLALCFYYATYLFYSESALCNCLNAKELLSPNREDIGSLSDCSWIGTHNHLARKRTLNHLAKMAIWLSCVASIYSNGLFDSMFLSCHKRVLEWIIQTSNIASFSSSQFFDIQATAECRFTLKRVCGMIKPTINRLWLY